MLNLKKIIITLKDMSSSCELCPRMCRADRLAGKTGFCRLTNKMMIGAAMPHYGEEPPLSGTNGAGTIFFSSCNLGCSYCQNYQISHSPVGRPVSAEKLADIMIQLQNDGCHNIEPVTPTPHLPGIMEALLLARDRGLVLPVVYNTGGYERKEIIALLDGQVQIYLPDFKYGREETGREISGVHDYPRQALNSLREMVRQVGDDLLVDEQGVAQSGIIVRHLVLPGLTENSIEALRMIREVSPFIPISIMSQYTPMPAMKDHPLLSRRITGDEYEKVVNAALDMGFTEIYTQDVDETAINPDFDRKDPFDWSMMEVPDA